MTNLYRGLRGLSFKLMRELGMQPQEVEEFVSAAREDVRNTRLHFSFPM